MPIPQTAIVRSIFISASKMHEEQNRVVATDLSENKLFESFSSTIVQLRFLTTLIFAMVMDAQATNLTH